MQTSPLLTILRALSKERWRALEKFVRSPYHVTHAGVPLLLDYLKSRLQHSPAEPLHQASVARALSEPDSRRVYHLTNYLLEAVELFLAQERWAEHPHDRHLATVEGLRHLHLADTGAGMLRYARKQLQQHPNRGVDYHRSDYRLHLEAYYLSQQQGRAKSFNVQELSDAQDVAFISEKLRTGCLLLSHQAVSKRQYDSGLLDSVLRFLENHRYLEIPAVAVYYHGYFAQLDENSDHHFQQLKALLQTHAAHFAPAETHDLYLMAINFCIRRINQAEERYFREVFELYQSGLQHGVLLEDGMLSRWTYNNITATGLRLREFSWVQHFLTTFAPFLPNSHRDGTFSFNFARYCYDTGDYRQAMQYLLRREYDDVLQNLAAKVMLCKIYYALGENDTLENQLDSIQIYLRRKKVLGYHRDNYLAIVRFLRKLLLHTPYDRDKTRQLQQLIAEAPVLTEREWLLRQLDIG